MLQARVGVHRTIPPRARTRSSLDAALRRPEAASFSIATETGTRQLGREVRSTLVCQPCSPGVLMVLACRWTAAQSCESSQGRAWRAHECVGE